MSGVENEIPQNTVVCILCDFKANIGMIELQSLREIMKNNQTKSPGKVDNMKLLKDNLLKKDNLDKSRLVLEELFKAKTSSARC